MSLGERLADVRGKFNAALDTLRPVPLPAHTIGIVGPTPEQARVGGTVQIGKLLEQQNVTLGSDTHLRVQINDTDLSGRPDPAWIDIPLRAGADASLTLSGKGRSRQRMLRVENPGEEPVELSLARPTGYVRRKPADWE